MQEDFQLAWHDGADWPEWGSAPRQPLVAFDSAHKGEWLDSVIGPDALTGKPMIYHVVRCELCIAIHVWPLPSLDTLSVFYHGQFYQYVKPDYLSRYERDRAWWVECTYRPLLRQCAMHIRLDCPEEDRVRYLDIGSGPGIGLETAQALGWQTTGIEPNSFLCERSAAQGHAMHRGILESISLPAGEQDVIMLYEVLEHQPCPEEFLLRCYDLLASDGIVVVCVPNDYSPIQLQACEKLGISRYWLAPPQHLFYWTPKTLQLCLRRCGFQMLDMRGTFPLDKFLLEGHNYVDNDEIGRKVHGWRTHEELTTVYSRSHSRWLQREQEYRLNISQRIGREIIAICHKQS